MNQIGSWIRTHSYELITVTEACCPQAPIDRFLLPKDLQALLEDRVKTYNNMAQVSRWRVTRNRIDVYTKAR